MVKEKKVKSELEELAVKYNAITGDQYEDFVQDLPVLSTGIPDLDMAFGPTDPVEGNGGLRARDILEVLGLPGSGKTALMHSMIKATQDRYPGKCIVGLFSEPPDIERMRREGINPDNIWFLGVNHKEAEDKKILAEYALNGLVEFVTNEEIKLAVIDSVGALFTTQQEDRSVNDPEAVADLAKCMNKFIVRFLKRSKVAALIMTNHYAEPINTGFGFNAAPSPLDINGPGGKGRKYLSKIRIFAKSYPKWREKGSEKVKHPETGGLIQDGLNISYVIFRNKYANSDSYRTVKTTLDFHRNKFNVEEGIINKALYFSYTDDNGEKKSRLDPPIFQGGSWYTIGDQRFQGMPKAVDYLAGQPELMKKLQAQLLKHANVFYGNTKIEALEVIDEV